MTKIIKMKGICNPCLTLEDNLLCRYTYYNFEIVLNLLDNKKFENDFSKPVNALLYNEKNNTVTFAKFNIETMDIIIDRTATTLGLKDKEAFFDYFDSEFDLDRRKQDLDDDLEEKLLYKTIDIDNNTAFAYYKNNTIDAFRFIDNKPFYIKIKGPEDLLNNHQELEEFAKKNKALIDDKFKEEVIRYKERYQQRLQIQRIDNANMELDKHVGEVRMNKKQKGAGRGI